LSFQHCRRAGCFSVFSDCGHHQSNIHVRSTLQKTI
jgi:hypothetical protein